MRRSVSVEIRLINERGVEVDSDDASPLRDALDQIVGEIARVIAELAGARMAGDHGLVRSGEHVTNGLVRRVGYVYDHSQAIHLRDDVSAEAVQPVPAGLVG